MHSMKMHMNNERESVYVRENPMGFDRLCSLVVLVGTEQVIARMVENDHVVRRFTALAERLSEAPEEAR